MATCFATAGKSYFDVSYNEATMDNDNINQQRAILGSGCITLIVAVLMLLCAVLCAILDKA